MLCHNRVKFWSIPRFGVDTIISHSKQETFERQEPYIHFCKSTSACKCTLLRRISFGDIWIWIYPPSLPFLLKAAAAFRRLPRNFRPASPGFVCRRADKRDRVDNCDRNSILCKLDLMPATDRQFNQAPANRGLRNGILAGAQRRGISSRSAAAK